MNEPSSVAARPASPERLALAQQAFTRFHTRCFWRLNLYDAATNKLVALMGRGEPRDYLDVLFLLSAF